MHHLNELIRITFPQIFCNYCDTLSEKNVWLQPLVTDGLPFLITNFQKLEKGKNKPVIHEKSRVSLYLSTAHLNVHKQEDQKSEEVIERD